MIAELLSPEVPAWHRGQQARVARAATSGQKARELWGGAFTQATTDVATSGLLQHPRR